MQKKERDDDIKRVYQMRVEGEIGVVQSIVGRTQPEMISNPVPSVKITLKTELNEKV